ncbi:hypothetical protein [Neorhizobium galegae]|uniref:hypothetical protein n=1 Tax=Neorhizobium galegae TaxID=399 RepID=UPI002103A85C|nr:hypothetical protein [Neorhizobium galegae]MCQ1852492.1 hypothetical protein [Neorhizobium galegae]
MSTTRREFNAGLISAIAVSGISNSASAGEPHGIDLLREQKYDNVIAPDSQFGTFGIGTVGLKHPSGVFG